MTYKTFRTPEWVDKIVVFCLMIIFVVLSVSLTHILFTSVLSPKDFEQTPITKLNKDLVAAQSVKIMWLIIEESRRAGVNHIEALNIALCESGLDPKAENKKSSAKGLFQFTFKTWTTYCEGNVFDPQDNTACFLKLYVYKPEWWECKGI